MSVKGLTDLQHASFMQANNVDDTTTANVTYVGLEHPSGQWLIKKLDETAALVITYASTQNNPTYQTYATAWAARVTLTYSAVLTAL